ncbi:hypothetical protein NE865_04625 [Phthorimaea operculella]|nr:hypothetical protein NE865_04625 [Phthorimaea operculella]
MDEDYYQITSELDAREVLRYLNHLGIHNISGEILKYFITDLKKLIKYDLQQKYKKKEADLDRPGPERLHGASTFSSRIRSKTQTNEKVVCSRECERLKKPFKLRNIHSAPAMGERRVAESEEKPLRKACSCTATEKRSETVSRATRQTARSALSNNIIIVPRPPVKKKSDPVSLYHYYTSLWAKYKPNVPGENDWADLRWQIRQRMAGLTSTQSENRIPDLPLKAKDSTHLKK